MTNHETLVAELKAILVKLRPYFVERAHATGAYPSQARARILAELLAEAHGDKYRGAYLVRVVVFKHVLAGRGLHGKGSFDVVVSNVEDRLDEPGEEVRGLAEAASVVDECLVAAHGVPAIGTLEIKALLHDRRRSALYTNKGGAVTINKYYTAADGEYWLQVTVRRCTGN